MKLFYLCREDWLSYLPEGFWKRLDLTNSILKQILKLDLKIDITCMST